MSEPLFTFLKSPGLVLNALQDSDAATIHRLRSDPKVNQYLDRPASQSEQDALTFIHKIRKGIAANTSCYWALRQHSNGPLMGTLCLWNFSAERQTAEIGYELLPAFQGKGYMQEALKEVIRFAFDRAGCRQLLAYTHKENLASSALLLKLNFIQDETKKDPDNLNHRIYSLSNNR